MTAQAKRDVDALPSPEPSAALDDLRQERHQIEDLKIETRFPRLATGDEQQIVNQAGRMGGGLAAFLQGGTVLRWSLLSAAQGDIGFAADDRQRRAQLVANVGE